MTAYPKQLSLSRIKSCQLWDIEILPIVLFSVTTYRILFYGSKFPDRL